MRNWILKLSTLILAVGLLVGCSATENNEQTGKVNGNNNQEVNNENNIDTSEEDRSEEIVTIIISKDFGEELIADQEITIKEGAILMDVLKENFSVEDDNGFVTSIDGEKQDPDKSKYWLYSVNGEDGMVGANEYELSAGDEVHFELNSME